MSSMKDLLGDRPFVFGGSTYSPSRDFDRLSRQAQRVAQFMERGNWVTLSEIAQATGDPEASVSARLRDLRRLGFTVEREYVERGLHRYRLKTRPEVEQPMRMAAE
jgi:biotin operon repressor